MSRAAILRGRGAWHLVFWGSLLPLGVVLGETLAGDLGPDPGKALTEWLGFTALVFLLLTLAISPLKRFTGVSLLHWRRMQGLYAFFYAGLHGVSYVLFVADWAAFIEDLLERPYITVGFVAFLILLILALTSPRFVVRRLGKRWKPLHRAV